MTAKNKKIVDAAIAALKGAALEEYEALDEAGKAAFAEKVIAEAEQAEAEKQAEKQAAAEKPVKVLVLVNCQHGKCGAVAEIKKSDLEAAKKGGLVDDNEDAVKSAEG